MTNDSAKQTPITPIGDCAPHDCIAELLVSALEIKEIQKQYEIKRAQDAEAKVLSITQDYIGMCDVVRDRDTRIADLERQLASAQRETIERCAQLCDEMADNSPGFIAEAIRALPITDPSAQNSGEEG